MLPSLVSTLACRFQLSTLNLLPPTLELFSAYAFLLRLTSPVMNHTNLYGVSIREGQGLFPGNSVVHRKVKDEFIAGLHHHV